MARTIITQAEPGAVTVTSGCHTARYWVPRTGSGWGYVRLGCGDVSDPQVCEGLEMRGRTLYAQRDDLLTTIRREHRRSRRLAPRTC